MVDYYQFTIGTVPGHIQRRWNSHAKRVFQRGKDRGKHTRFSIPLGRPADAFAGKNIAVFHILTAVDAFNIFPMKLGFLCADDVIFSFEFTKQIEQDNQPCHR